MNWRLYRLCSTGGWYDSATGDSPRGELFDAVLDDWNISAEIYADRDHPSQEREEQIKA